ncbi:DUF1840 domain-containing protein [Rheinheimera sp.]|uniref:DUF1840 domain-containing protein n=1 Tax=Rheinheimera sp. TaxID=1869214 RepID=UPI0027B92CE8|nr:DUF1840 domain-containing protein [Rheinheimera sp.]
MLVTFHSKDYYPITMFGDVALQLIEKMGVTPKVPGAVYAEDVPQALWQLQQALEDLPLADEVEPLLSTQADALDTSISLRKRAVPLLEMLKGAAKAGHNISWD